MYRIRLWILQMGKSQLRQRHTAGKTPSCELRPIVTFDITSLRISLNSLMHEVIWKFQFKNSSVSSLIVYSINDFTSSLSCSNYNILIDTPMSSSIHTLDPCNQLCYSSSCPASRSTISWTPLSSIRLVNLHGSLVPIQDDCMTTWLMSWVA